MSRRSRRSVRNRLDAVSLRLQARLDTPWVDRSLPWFMAGVLALILVTISLAVQRQLDGGPALAVWTQAAWNLEHGRGAVSSLAGGNVVTDQWAFASLPLLWLGRWVPMGPVLAVAQAACLSLAVVPLWRIAREHARLRLGATAALALAYCGAPIVYSANLYGWSAVAPAVPALAWAVWFSRRGRWLAYLACVAVALASRADVGLVLVGFGLLWISAGQRRSGLFSLLVGGTWTAAFVIAVGPRVPVGPLTAAETVLARGIAPLAVLRDPLRLVTDLFLQPNVGAVVILLGPLLFLPAVAPRFLLPAVPSVVLGLVGEEAVRQAAGPAMGGDPFPSVLLLALVPLVLAATVALGRLGEESVTRIRVDHRIIGAMLLATITIFVQAAPASPFNQPWSWGSRDAVDGARMEAVDLLEEEYGSGALTVSPQVAPLVAERAALDEMPFGPPAAGWQPRTRAVLLDTTAVAADGTQLWDERDRDEVTMALIEQSFAVRYRSAGIVLLIRPE